MNDESKETMNDKAKDILVKYAVEYASAQAGESHKRQKPYLPHQAFRDARVWIMAQSWSITPDLAIELADRATTRYGARVLKLETAGLLYFEKELDNLLAESSPTARAAATDEANKTQQYPTCGLCGKKHKPYPYEELLKLMDNDSLSK